MDDFNASMYTLTAGLRELPTDDAARVKHFLAEYLGHSAHPVPFGGRGKDFARLDAWLTDHQAPPYTLLAAPAGRGKSALLLRWCQQLLTRADLAVVYFPVSIRFRTNLAGVVFPALVALLARLHGEKLPGDQQTPVEVWRSLLSEYMTRPLPDGRLLVLVLDGVDEAADWTAGPDLFPSDPPPGLRVVLSARYLANDQDAGAWLTRLGWTRPGLARTLELYPLDRAGIASVLLQMGFPVDLLSTRVDIVSELHRLSEGDPLLIRLYVDDLWERGEAALRLKPEDLHAIRPGLVGYFERWWNDQRALWSEEAPQREAAIQSVLELLAGALGPLSQTDILSMTPDEAGLNRANLAHELEPLARFVIGDGVRQGYVFSHPRLASYFLEERLSSQERQEIEGRFLDWGKQTLADLNEERMSPEKASAYIVQYYGAHLERAQADVSDFLALVSDGWRSAWERLDRAQAGFLGDSTLAWRAAERENAAAAQNGQQLPYLGAEIRSLLCRVSINSMTSNISPRLMLEAVKTGIWTPAQGLATLRLIVDPVPRARELVGLALYVPEPLRTDILQEALDTLATIPAEYARLDALVELAPGFSEELLGQILVSMSTIADEADRAGTLAELAPTLSALPALIEQALVIAQNIEEEEYLALALAGLAPTLSAQQQEHGLHIAHNIQDERYRTQALTAMIPHLPENLLQATLLETSHMWNTLCQARLLAELANYLPDPLQTEARDETLKLMSEIVDQEYRVELFLKLAPYLTEEQLHQVLQETQTLWDESYQAQVLDSLLPYLPAELLPGFLSTVRAMKHEAQRTGVALHLFSRLPATLLEQALEMTQATWDEGLRVELLARLAPAIPEALLPQLLELIQAIQDPGYQIWLLAELDASIAGVHPATTSDLKQALQAIGDTEERLQILLAIISRLSNEALAKIFSFMLPEIFGFRWVTQSAARRTQILCKIGPRLPANWLPTAMKVVGRLGNEAYQVQVLLVMAPRIDANLLPAALEIVRSMHEREKRAQVLEVLVSSLPEKHKGARVREMLQVLQIIRDENERVSLVAAYTSALSGTFPAERVQVVFRAVEALQTETHQARVLTALAPHLPETMVHEMLNMVQRIQNVEERGQILDRLAPHIPQPHFSAFVAATQAVESERLRAQVLATLVAHAPQESFAELLRVAQSIRGEAEQVIVLRALAPRTPEASFAQLWSAIQNIDDSRKRAWILGSLTLRVPEAFFPQLWRAIQEIEDEGWQLRALDALASSMSDNFFERLWRAVQSIKDELRCMRAISVLALHVPEHFFWEMFVTVQALSATSVVQAAEKKAGELLEEKQLNALEVLAERVPERFFAQFWEAVSTLRDQWRKARLQVILAMRVPEAFFSQVWQTIWHTKDTWLQATLLEALAPHVPDKFFEQFWETLKMPKFRARQLAILKALLPRLSREYLAEVLNAINILPYPKGQAEMLEALLPYLSAEQSARILETLLPPPQLLIPPHESKATGQETWLRGRQAQYITGLACRLHEQGFLEYLPNLLQMARRTPVDEDRVGILTVLAARIPEQALPEMLELLWTIEVSGGYEDVLAALLPMLKPDGWTKMLELTMTKVQQTGNTHVLIQLLQAASTLTQPPAPALLYPALHATLRLLAQKTRRATMTNLAPLAAIICALGGDAAGSETCSAVLEVGHWWP